MDPSKPADGARTGVSAIIVAAGSSRRMGFNKLLAPLAGLPVLLRSLLAFQNCQSVDDIILVTSGEIQALLPEWRQAHDLTKITHVLPGGAERHFSVSAGLRVVSRDSGIVAVHDGARPLISDAQIIRCIESAKTNRAVTCARPVTETLKRCDELGRITGSIDRTHAWIMETPQVFEVDLLVRAYDHVLAEGLVVTDEVSAVQTLGVPVHVVTNDTPNPKITFPEDLNQAEKVLLASS